MTQLKIHIVIDTTKENVERPKKADRQWAILIGVLCYLIFIGVLDGGVITWGILIIKMEYAMANGYIFYEDDSIVGIITGLMLGSSNTKTGAMPQTWILVKDINPIEAVNTGADKLICGDCKHRGTVVSVDEKRDKKSYSVRNGLKTINKQRKCYVKLFQAPYSVWKSYKKR